MLLSGQVAHALTGLFPCVRAYTHCKLGIAHKVSLTHQGRCSEVHAHYQARAQQCHYMMWAQAVMTFDLGCPAGDAAWAPYSATVFAAAGEDGRVQVSSSPSIMPLSQPSRLRVLVSTILVLKAKRGNRSA